MIEQKNIAYSVVIGMGIIIFLVSFLIYRNNSEESIIVINNHEINVEIVSTVNQLKKGLGGRGGICENCGMLFEFSDKRDHTFWMRDMQFDIDMVWINDDKVVAVSNNVDHMTPFKEINVNKITDKVLEIQSGQAKILNINTGDNVECIK